MPFFKGVYTFENSDADVGWTHSWWTSAADWPTAGAQLAGHGQKYMAMCTANIHWRSLRISNVDHQRDSFYFNIAGTPPNDGQIAWPLHPDIGYDEALLARRDNSVIESLFGHLFLHGLPKEITLGRVFVPAGLAGWAAAYAAWQTEIEGGNYLIRKKNAVGPPSYVLCDTISIIRVTTHRVGRPFDPLRGRRRTR
jgi:hypothetical protein